MKMTTWRVWKMNRFVGYVVEATESSAARMAREKYGIGTRVERTLI